MRRISVEEAAAATDAWRDLAAGAVEPNLFYEPEFLLPALTHLAGPDRAELVVIEGRSLDPKRPEPVWCGVIAVQGRMLVRGRRLPTWATWRHPYAYVGTPLIRAGFVAETTEAFLDWLATEATGRTFLLNWLPADGPVLRQFVVSLQQRGQIAQVVRQFARAEFRPDPAVATADAYCATHWSRSTRHNVRRFHRRLTEEGAFAFETFDGTQDAVAWREEFLRLEHAGWKGAEGTSLVADSAHEAFFREVWDAAVASGRLLAHRMSLDGVPIAMNCALICSPSQAGTSPTDSVGVDSVQADSSGSQGGYYWRTAFDEAQAKRSPGVVQEMLFLETLYARNVAWMDSCAQPGHPMIDRLWAQRRLVQSLVFSTGRPLGGTIATVWASLAAAERLAASVYKRFRRRPSATGSQA